MAFLLLFLEECSNCDGCSFQGSCINYDPTGSDGPLNVEACTNNGGLDCSGNLFIKIITFYQGF